MSAAAPLRLVLDTNVWLDWLVFADAAIEPIKRAHANGAVEICIDDACARELIAVLAYDLGKHTLDSEAQASCLAECRRIVRMVATETMQAAIPLPRCSDADDQKFLELARNCAADYLLTKDRALLVLARRKSRPPPCGIVTPREMGSILENAEAPAPGDFSRRY